MNRNGECPLRCYIKGRMKLQQIKVAQNIQKLFLHITSLNLSEFEYRGYFECSFY